MPIILASEKKSFFGSAVLFLILIFFSGEVYGLFILVWGLLLAVMLYTPYSQMADTREKTGA